MASSAGNQIFVQIKKGTEYPPKVVEVRCKYEQTIKDLRNMVAKKAGLELDKLQLFWHGKEMKPEDFDQKTLLDMDLHTGFSLMGYDLNEEPDYWPPVRKTEAGLEVIPAIEQS